jgi:hypothetical protein
VHPNQIIPSRPAFVKGERIAPYVGRELADKLENPIIFQSQAVGAGTPYTTTHGYDVTILIDLCKAIITDSLPELRAIFSSSPVGDGLSWSEFSDCESSLFSQLGEEGPIFIGPDWCVVGHPESGLLRNVPPWRPFRVSFLG